MDQMGPGVREFWESLGATIPDLDLEADPEPAGEGLVASVDLYGDKEMSL